MIHACTKKVVILIRKPCIVKIYCAVKSTKYFYHLGWSKSKIKWNKKQKNIMDSLVPGKYSMNLFKKILFLNNNGRNRCD